MKTRRTLFRIALLGYALAAATTAPPSAQAAGSCGPDSWSCRTATQCTIFCGSASASSCSAGCCVCLPPIIRD